MIDVENMVVDAVAKAVKTQYPNATIKSEKQDVPSSFPFVSITEEDNTSYRKTQDDVSKEHHAEVMYEVNVYSNLESGKKSEAKSIFSIVDETLQSIKFTRTTKLPINKDSTIYRIVGRYEAVIAEDNNGIYQVYRE